MQVILQVLLDIGAGQGLFSLAAAARGHRAIAFELSANSLASMEASIAFNGFQDLLTLHKVVHYHLHGRLRALNFDQQKNHRQQ
jgi:cyclopropane fatty-acyl-phospholipid synthase-like methyltransferase